jgi:hypothetical protein
MRFVGHVACRVEKGRNHLGCLCLGEDISLKTGPKEMLWIGLNELRIGSSGGLS